MLVLTAFIPGEGWISAFLSRNSQIGVQLPGAHQPFRDVKYRLQKQQPLLRGYTHQNPPLGKRVMQPHKDSSRLECTLLPVPISSGTALLRGLFAAACPGAAKASRPAQPKPRPPASPFFAIQHPALHRPQPCLARSAAPRFPLPACRLETCQMPLVSRTRSSC